MAAFRPWPRFQPCALPLWPAPAAPQTKTGHSSAGQPGPATPCAPWA